MLRQQYGQHLDPEHVSRLLALTEGWPASVVLAGMALAWLDAESLEDALSDPRLRGDVFSYLAEQVFQRQSEDVQRFLLRTCCLDHVNGDLAERLTGERSASRHLSFLARNHVFTFDTGRRARIATTTCCATSSAAVRTRGGRAGLRAAAARRPRRWRPPATGPVRSSSCSSPTNSSWRSGSSLEAARPSSSAAPPNNCGSGSAGCAAPAEIGHPWALTVSAVVDARESRFASALSNSAVAATCSDVRTAGACIKSYRSRSGRSSGPATRAAACPHATGRSTTRPPMLSGCTRC